MANGIRRASRESVVPKIIYYIMYNIMPLIRRETGNRVNSNSDDTRGACERALLSGSPRDPVVYYRYT